MSNLYNIFKSMLDKKLTKQITVHCLYDVLQRCCQSQGRRNLFEHGEDTEYIFYYK